MSFDQSRWPMLSSALTRRISLVTGDINCAFDRVTYAGLMDLEDGHEPNTIDLSGFNSGQPSVITLSPQRTDQMILDQFDYEASTLAAEMLFVSKKIQFLAGASQIEWVEGLKAELILPPTIQELIRWKGRTQGWDYQDHITDPVIYVHGKVRCTGVKQ